MPRDRLVLVIELPEDSSVKTPLRGEMQLTRVRFDEAPGSGIGNGYRSALAAFPGHPERLPGHLLPFRFDELLLAKHPPQEQPNHGPVAIGGVAPVADRGDG